MSQRLEAAIACLAKDLTAAITTLTESNTENFEALCEKLEAERTLTPIVGDACCVLIDGVAGYAAPVRVFNGEEGTLSETVQWVNPDTLAPLTGTVEPANPCDCDCLSCPDAEAVKLTVVDANVTGEDATFTTTAALSEGGIGEGTNVQFMAADGSVKASGTMKEVSGIKGSLSGLEPAGTGIAGCMVQATAQRTKA